MLFLETERNWNHQDTHLVGLFNLSKCKFRCAIRTSAKPKASPAYTVSLMSVFIQRTCHVQETPGNSLKIPYFRHYISPDDSSIELWLFRTYLRTRSSRPARILVQISWALQFLPKLSWAVFKGVTLPKTRAQTPLTSRLHPPLSKWARSGMNTSSALRHELRN